MPGVRDRNFRSGDLHEELGLVLLRTVALVAPVPRPEDIGTDAFATLIRPEGSRRLLPDVSFLVQLKAASYKIVSYDDADSINWIRNLEIPLFIGRVNLPAGRIELFSTQRLHQILLETQYDSIHLLLDEADESSQTLPPNERRANIGPPVYAWSLTDAARPDFLADAHTVLRPHVEGLARNRRLRDIRYQETLNWETGKPPTGGTIMMTGSIADNMQTTLQGLVPNLHRLISAIGVANRYADLATVFDFITLLRRWGVDPDPGNILLSMVALRAVGPEIPDEEVMMWRYHAGRQFGGLDLTESGLSDSSLAGIPADVANLALTDLPITDAGIVDLLRLTKLDRLVLSGTSVTDEGIGLLCTLPSLRYLAVERTAVTGNALDQLKTRIPQLEVKR